MSTQLNVRKHISFCYVISKVLHLKLTSKKFISSSSKILKMEAYDAAVLSYALATAAGKLKPGLLGVPAITSVAHSNMQPNKYNEEVSHTPPMRQEARAEENIDHGHLYQLLCSLEQAFVSKGVVQLSQLLEICSCKQVGKYRHDRFLV